jgi:choline dehydrogenase-like flavoprotein
MINIDARTLSDNEVVESDVCIIGAGPAGTTLAREFINTGLKVNLLESGGETPDFEVYKLSEGTISGHMNEPLEQMYLRQIGGTANNFILQTAVNQWGYRYTPLEEIDFEQRDAVPYSGWPLCKSELDPYYARVQSLCDIGPYDYSAAYWTHGDMQPLPLNPNKVHNSVFMFGPTAKFRQEFPEQIKQSSNVQIFTYATVVELLCSDDGLSVASALVRTFEGKEIYFKAKKFIITANALQTPRLLLSSTRHYAKGIGNQHDNVGRYYMDHCLVPSGSFIPYDSKLINTLGFYDMQALHGVSALGKLMLSPNIMRDEGLVNFAAMFFPVELSQVDTDAMNSVALLHNHLTYKTWPKDLWKHLFNAFKGRNRVFRAFYEKARYNVPILTSLARGGWSKAASNHKKYDRLELTALTEQSPNPENRLILTDEKDALACYKVKVRYVWSDKDVANITRAQQIMAEALEETGLGRYEPPKLPAESVKSLGGTHHMMGTTRMSDDPKHGVVDRNCKVHGILNLFIAGSAVFPTGGYANPTLTNLAISIRVADHVKMELAT